MVAFVPLFHRPVALVAAGITFTNRTTSAGWAARCYHTSVIDAAGAIYVLGGIDSDGTRKNDVWVGTGGGADPRGYSGVLGGTYRVTQGALMRCLCGAQGVQKGYHEGHSGHTATHARARAQARSSGASWAATRARPARP